MFVLVEDKMVVELFDEKPVFHQDLMRKIIQVEEAEEGDYIIDGVNLAKPPSDAHTIKNGKWYISFDEEKSRAKYRVLDFIEKCRGIVTGGANASKQASWTRKAAAADRFDNNSANDADMLLANTEALSRGLAETAQDLFVIWKAKDLRLMKALALIDGLGHKALREVENAEQSEIESLLAQLKTQAQQALVSLENSE